jgi:hypothetical protein
MRRLRAKAYSVAGGICAVVVGVIIFAGCENTATTPLPDIDPVEKIANGQFTNDLTGWQGGIGDTAAAGAVGVVDSAYRATITKAGTQNWHIQLCQSVQFTSGKTYTVSLDAYSPEGARVMNAQCQQNGGDYHPIGGWTDKVLNLTTTKQTFTYTFSCTETNTGGRLNFDMGNMGLNDVVIDNVSLIEE